MKPERSNYEIWLIDWLDGNLNPLQIEQLQSFLDENPDLRGEVDALTLLKLNPGDKSYTGKEKLKKSSGELTSSQFEYLSVARIENDLSADQVSELDNIIINDPERKRTFELIQKTKLIPPKDQFGFKKKLKKISSGQKIIRLSFIGLSAAATIALLVVAYYLIPVNLTEKSDQTAQNLNKIDTIIMVSPEGFVKMDVVKYEDQIKITSGLKHTRSEKAEFQPGVILAEGESIDRTDSIFSNRGVERFNIPKIIVSDEIRLVTAAPNNVLIAYNPKTVTSVSDEERSNVERFIAKLVHEKILKDSISLDRPLKAYDIAEAGIIGLNKLLGWKMAFYRNTNENGELQSIYFSSKILKFNLPVKKAVQAQ